MEWHARRKGVGGAHGCHVDDTYLRPFSLLGQVRLRVLLLLRRLPVPWSAFVDHVLKEQGSQLLAAFADYVLPSTLCPCSDRSKLL